MKTRICFFLFSMLPLLAGCDEADISTLDDPTSLLEDRANQEAFKVDEPTYSPDYKTFTIKARQLRDIGPFSLEDTSQVRYEVKERVNGVIKKKRRTPKLVKFENTKAEMLSKNGTQMLVLVDQTLPQKELDAIQRHVYEIRTVFNRGNLFLAFMEGDSVSKTVPATDYVMDNYFTHSAGKDYVLLYRSMLKKKQEMCNRQGYFAAGQHFFMLTISDDMMYMSDNDQPLDPEHYSLEEQMVKADDGTAGDFFASYVSYNRYQQGNDAHDTSVLDYFCTHHAGMVTHEFNWMALEGKLLSALKFADIPSYVLYFVNPDMKVYDGSFYELTADFNKAHGDSLIASMSTTVKLGHFYKPIIVHGHGILVVLLQGLIVGLVIFFLVWLLFQFFVPYVSYRYFLRRYVVRYTGSNMSYDKQLVQQSCYLCKAPFVTGDEIVVKCAHTMHKSCWDENDHHCPEYSDRCKHGSHYYNRHDVFDKHNASFYMRWVLMAILSATLAWMFFVVAVHVIGRVELITISPLTFFGFFCSFFLTYGIAALAMRLRNIRRHSASLLWRSLAAALGSFVVFLAVSMSVSLFDAERVGFFFDWISWTISAFIIAFCATWHTRVVLRQSLILPSILLGVLSMYVWWLLFVDTIIDIRVLQLFSFIFFSVGLAVCIARTAPRSERYFLKVQGAVKEMDVALYKWFRNDPDRVVTLGKSVDCSLQLSWDYNGNVAPVHAKLTITDGIVCLTALEDGVYYKGKQMDVDQREVLYHGDRFTIGNTNFTYVEKDFS